MITYAVIDTNVLVSALLTNNAQSPTARVVDYMSFRRIVPIYTGEIMAEYTEVLHRRKFNFKEDEIQALLGLITKVGISSSRIPYLPPMPDEKDRVFYEVSLSKEDSYLVTGNLKHFPRTPKVVTPAEMMAIIDSAE